MREQLLQILRCPNCRGSSLVLETPKVKTSVILDGNIICQNCKSVYTICDGVPILLPKYHTDCDNQKLKEKFAQIDYYNKIGDTPEEVHRPHQLGKLYNYLINYKLNTVVNQVKGSISGKQVLNICCGSGMEAEFLASCGAQVIGLDISFAAVKGAQKRAHIYGFPLDVVVGDAEVLPFIDSTFDYGFTHDGLHHLSVPECGLAELLRVARIGILFCEPSTAWLTTLSRIIGLGKEYEPSGNRVNRFNQKEIKTILHRLGINEIYIHRFLSYYPHNPGKKFVMFELNMMMWLFKCLYWCINKSIGRWGNKLTLIAYKP